MYFKRVDFMVCEFYFNNKILPILEATLIFGIHLNLRCSIFPLNFCLLGRNLLWHLLWPWHTIICVAFKGLKRVSTEMDITRRGWEVIHTGTVQVANSMTTENLLWSSGSSSATQKRCLVSVPEPTRLTQYVNSQE